MKLRTKFENAIKNTVGYAEAADKVSFMTGFEVAFTLISAHYEAEADLLKREVKDTQEKRDEYGKGLSTIVQVITKYQ